MTNLFNWLRYIRLALAMFVLVVSVASGIPIGTNEGQGDPFAVLTRLVGGAAELAENAASGSSGGGGALGEIVDEPIGAVGPPGAVGPSGAASAETPGGSLGAGAVIGGGESIGPGGDAVTPVAAVPAPAPGEQASNPAAPTATSSAIVRPAAPPSPSPRATAAPSAAGNAQPTPTPTPTPGAIRLDEPVLRFLPEITAAAKASGVPASILAGVVRVESNGDPNLIANGSRIGLTGVSDAGLANQGVPPSSWNDPSANLLAGAGALAGLYGSTGSWDAALEAYFGGTCDSTGACPGEYRYAVQAWSTYYAAGVSNPSGSGFATLPSTWSPPPVAPYQGASPRPIPLPPGVAAPTPTPQPTETPVPTVPPTTAVESPSEGEEPPTVAPTEPATSPTEPPTPTIVPVAVETPPPAP